MPKTKEEIAKDLVDAKAALERERFEATNHFSGIGDLSNGQYGTLGAWALTDAEIELPIAYWQVSDRFWRLTQRKDGCWGYEPSGGKPEATMGVAGIASLFLTSEQVDTQIRLDPKPDKEIDLGLAWLNANFKPNTNGYYMYGVERIGLASGLKFFGTTNWYEKGAATLVKAQGADGSWDGGFIGSNKFRATAYSLLFLARGRNPVVFNKLEYNGPWNARPRDSANITRWMSKAFEKPINWQIVNLKVNPEEWLDAPVLLITGSKALNFSAEEVAKLRAYVDAGGMIFSTSDGGRADFTESIKKIASQLVEENGKPKYEMRDLPKDHMLFSLKQELWTPVNNPPRILAMSNGVREIWVHSMADLGASWQGRKIATTDHFVFPANLYRYASGKASLRSKLSPLTVPAPKEAPKQKLTLARIDYAGNWDPEPGAWPRMARVMALNANTGLELKTIKFADLDAKKTPLAHITGTTAFPAGEADAAAVKKFLEDGGTLLADAAGGRPGVPAVV